jgi:DNA (cytosine-5)-methyltransferase 1
MANAGFHHAAVIEWDADACETFRQNQQHRVPVLEDWPLHQADVREFDFSSIGQDIVVVSGGPPCQPFSLGGKHKGYRDQRDMFPEAVRAVRELRPKAFLFENVKGLMRETFASYFGYIQLQLMYPGFVRSKAENWKEHRERLEKHHTLRRGRVFTVGFRAGLGAQWGFLRGGKTRPATRGGDCALGVGFHYGTVVERNKFRFRVPDGLPQ